MISGLPAFVLRYLMSRTWMSVVSLCLVGAAAIWTWSGLDSLSIGFGVTTPRALALAPCDTNAVGGANIELANAVVACGAMALVIGVVFVQNHRLRLASLLAAGAVVLCVGVGLVASDSATYAVDNPCGVASPLLLLSLWHIPLIGAVSGVSWLFALWGVTLALVLLRAFGAWKGVEPPPLRRRYRTPRAWHTGA